MTVTVDDLETLERQAEQMLRDFFNGPDAGHRLPDEIRAVLAGQLGMNDREIQRETQRVIDVQRWEASVLPDAEVQRVQADLSEAQATLETEGPKIQKQIDTLQRRLAELQRAPARFEQQLQENQTARQNLESLMPRWTIRKLQQLQSEHRAAIGDVADLRSVIQHIRVVLANPENVDIVRLYEWSPTRSVVEGRDDLQPLLDRQEFPGSRTFILGPKCQQHFELMGKKLPELEADLSRMEAELDSVLGAAERELRSIYYRG